MTARNLFILDAIIIFAYGIPMLIVPQALGGTFLVDKTAITPVVVILLRLFSLTLIPSGLLVLTGLKAQSVITRKTIFLAIILSGGGHSILHIIAILQKIVLPVGWVTVFIDGLLTIWALILFVKEKSPE